MMKIFLTLPISLLFFLTLTPFAFADASANNEKDELAKRYAYFKVRHEIGCRDRDENDARCFWQKVNLVYAKTILGRGDIAEVITADDIERINKKLIFLERRYEKYCENADEPAKFCSALGKLIERGRYFQENPPSATEEHSSEENALTPEQLRAGQFNFGDPGPDGLNPFHLEADIRPWIELGASPQDKSTKEERIKALSLTEKGRKMLDALEYEY